MLTGRRITAAACSAAFALTLLPSTASAALARPPEVERDGVNRAPADISADGRYALTIAPTGGSLRRVDLTTGAIVSLGFSAQGALLTDNGSAMVFESAQKLVPTDTNGATDLYQYTFSTKAFALIRPVALPASVKAGWVTGELLDISGNGMVLALHMINPSLGGSTVFLYARSSHTWRVPDKLFTGWSPGPHRTSIEAKVSSNGLVTAWVSAVGTTSGYKYEVWIYNWTTNSKTLASVTYTGASLPNTASSGGISLSSDGTKVSFRSNGANLVKGLPAKSRVYVRDLTHKITRMVTANEDPYTQQAPQLAGNGSVLVVNEVRFSYVSFSPAYATHPIMYYVGTAGGVGLDVPAGNVAPNGVGFWFVCAGAAHRILFSTTVTNFMPVKSPMVPNVPRVFAATYF